MGQWTGDSSCKLRTLPLCTLPQSFTGRELLCLLVFLEHSIILPLSGFTPRRKHVASGVTKVIFSLPFHGSHLQQVLEEYRMRCPLDLPAAPAVRSMAAWMAGLDFMFGPSSAGFRGRQLSGAYDGRLIALRGDKSSPSVGPLQLTIYWDLNFREPGDRLYISPKNGSQKCQCSLEIGLPFSPPTTSS